jgi:hypothetical protein
MKRSTISPPIVIHCGQHELGVFACRATGDVLVAGNDVREEEVADPAVTDLSRDRADGAAHLYGCS